MRPALPRPGLQRPAPRRRTRGRAAQAGQALIEFAILAMLIFLLVAGGVELFTASVGGERSRAAAEAGAEQWRAVVGEHGQPELALEGASNTVIAVAYGLAGSEPGTAAEYGLGEHDFGVFEAPGCEAVLDGYCIEPWHGLPLPADRPGTPALEGDVYLFNPVPVDVSACVPEGRSAPAHEGCVRRIFEGCPAASAPGAEGCVDDYPGLPALNQALYGLYQLHCIDESRFNPGDAMRQMACPEKRSPDTDAVRWLLRLPGKHFIKPRDVAAAEDAAAAAGLADNPCPLGSTCLTVVDSRAAPVLADFASGKPNPKPMFELDCQEAAGSGGFAPCDSRDAPAGLCWAPPAASAVVQAPVPLACRVRVQARYRHHFNGFLASAFYSGSNLTGRPLPEDLTLLLDRGVQVTGLCPSDQVALSGEQCVPSGLVTGPLANFREDPGAGGYGADVTSVGAGTVAGAASAPDRLLRDYFLIPSKDFLGCASTSVQREGGQLRAPVQACN